MKFLVALLLTAILSFIIGLFFPWWGIAVVALIVAVIVHQKPGKAFLSGLLGVMAVWSGLAIAIDIKNQGVLSEKIAHVLPLGGNAILLIILTGLIGGLVAGLAALSGSYLRASQK